MQYITTSRFRGKGLYSELFNIPYGSKCECYENIIYYQHRPICFITSQNAYDYFSRNDDGYGLERGKLIKEIMSILVNKKDGKYQERWDKLWEDEYCHKFRRKEHGEHWLWSFDFYNAEIKDLQYIFDKIKGVK